MKRFLPGLASLFVIVWFTVLSQAAEETSGELVGLDVSLAAEKQLVVFDQLVQGQEWVAALDLLDRLQIDSSTALVKQAPGRYVGLSVAIQQRLTLLPQVGQELLRRRHQTTVTALLQRAQAERDEAALWRVATRFGAMVPAKTALHELAAQAAGRGDLELALRLWGRLQGESVRELRIFPPPIVSLVPAEPEVTRDALLKAIVARNAVGNPLSEVELRAVGVDPATSKLALRPLAQLLGSVPKDELSAIPPGSLRWSTMATPIYPQPESAVPLDLVVSPGGLVLLNNGQMVRALRAVSGEPFWPSGLPEDVGILYEDVRPYSDSQGEIPSHQAGGVATRDRYFGVIGDAPRWSARPRLVPLSGTLISMDLAEGQGRVVWRKESRDLPEPEWLFHGAPVLMHGAWTNEALVVVPLCKPAPQVELALAAFSQDDGQLVWWTRIGTSATEAGQLLPPTQLIGCAGLLIARTLTGVVVAVESHTGAMQWASTQLVAAPPVSHGTAVPLLDARAGVLVVANPNQSEIVALSLDGGEELWKQTVPFTVHGVVCGPRGKVLISGQRLRAVTMLQGQPVWEHGFDDPSAAGTGVPVIAEGTVHWPTRTGLWGLSLEGGQIEYERRLTSGPIARPMRLVDAEGQWFLVLPDAVVCLQHFKNTQTPEREPSHPLVEPIR